MKIEVLKHKKLHGLLPKKHLFYVTSLTYLLLPQDGFSFLGVSKENVSLLPTFGMMELINIIG